MKAFICPGETFVVTPQNGIPTNATIVPNGTTYCWSSPIVTGGVTGGCSETNQPSVNGVLMNYTQALQTATYTVTPTAGSCTGSIFTVIITIYPQPIASFNVVGNNPHHDDEVQFVNTSQYAINYVWDFEDGDQVNSSDANITHSFAFNGTYNVTLIAINSYGCKDSISHEVEDADYFLKVPNALSPTDPDTLVNQFKPIGKGLKIYLMQIYDTWGNLKWETSKLDIYGRPSEGWKGKDLKGKDLPMDVYSWTIYAKFIDGTDWEGTDDKQHYKTAKSGTVTLVK